jgi:hypothetical protein
VSLIEQVQDQPGVYSKTMPQKSKTKEQQKQLCSYHCDQCPALYVFDTGEDRISACLKLGDILT